MYKTIVLILIFLSRFDPALAKSNDIYNIKKLKQTKDWCCLKSHIITPEIMAITPNLLHGLNLLDFGVLP